MQVEAIQGLERLKENGQDRGLLISATGTGKTYLSAFELRNYNPERALFIVHREQIAKQALNSFRNVFGDTRSMGILSSTSKDVDKNFIFVQFKHCQRIKYCNLLIKMNLITL